MGTLLEKEACKNVRTHDIAAAWKIRSNTTHGKSNFDTEYMYSEAGSEEVLQANQSKMRCYFVVMAGSVGDVRIFFCSRIRQAINAKSQLQPWHVVSNDHTFYEIPRPGIFYPFTARPRSLQNKMAEDCRYVPFTSNLRNYLPFSSSPFSKHVVPNRSVYQRPHKSSTRRPSWKGRNPIQICRPDFVPCLIQRCSPLFSTFTARGLVLVGWTCGDDGTLRRIIVVVVAVVRARALRCFVDRIEVISW